MFDTDVGSNSRSALALIGREAHSLVLHMRDAFHRWKFPAPCLTSRMLLRMCTITAKNRNAAVKIKNNTGKCFQ